jgi:proteasome lid subunit RPN8/RPN11
MQQVFRQARAAFPAECCGWLSGPRGGSSVDAVRPCQNSQDRGVHVNEAADDRGDDLAYAILGADQLTLATDYDKSPTPPQIIYHSHPNGRAYFSETDAADATPFGEPSFDVQQLVVGIDGDRVTEAALFDWSEADSAFVEVARFGGADL